MFSWRNKKKFVFFFLKYFLSVIENICCGYSLEAPWQGTSIEYPQHMFSWRNKKKYQNFSVEKKKKRLTWSYDNIISSVKQSNCKPIFFFF